MEIEKEFLTVAEFAEALGISKQAVYKRQKELEPYIEMRNGVRYISVSAFPLFGNPELKKKENDAEAIISTLKAQLEAKDKTIETLQNHLIEQSKTLSDIIQSQNELQNNFQILLARIYDGKIMLPAQETRPEEKQAVENEVETVVERSINVKQQVETAETEPKKKSFFSRFFKKS